MDDHFSAAQKTKLQEIMLESSVFKKRRETEKALKRVGYTTKQIQSIAYNDTFLTIDNIIEMQNSNQEICNLELDSICPNGLPFSLNKKCDALLVLLCKQVVDRYLGVKRAQDIITILKDIGQLGNIEEENLKNHFSISQYPMLNSELDFPYQSVYNEEIVCIEVKLGLILEQYLEKIIEDSPNGALNMIVLKTDLLYYFFPDDVRKKLYINHLPTDIGNNPISHIASIILDINCLSDFFLTCDEQYRGYTSLGALIEMLIKLKKEGLLPASVSIEDLDKLKSKARRCKLLPSKYSSSLPRNQPPAAPLGLFGLG